MKEKFVALAVLVALALPALAQVSVKYDEFRQVTEVELSPPRGGLLNPPEFYAHTTKEAVSKDPAGNHITIGFTSTSKDWEYLDCHFLHALADGTPVELGESKHDGSVGHGYVIEFVDVHVSLATLTKLANAKEARFKLCGTVIPISPREHEELAQFLAALTDKSKSTTDGTAAGGTETTPALATQPVQAVQNPRGLVAAIDGNDIYISLGKADGVKVGDTLAVFADEGSEKKLGVFTVKKVFEGHLSSGTFEGTAVTVGAWVNR